VPSPVIRHLIYTLAQDHRSTRWDAAMGVRTTEGLRKRDSLSVRQSFDAKDEAERWLLELATALNVPSPPKSLRSTREPLRLGGDTGRCTFSVISPRAP